MIRAALLSFVLAACGRSPAPEPSKPTEPAEPPAQTPPTPVTTETKPDAPAPTPIAWTIAKGKVGPIELGKALPEAVLKADLEKTYVARYIADGQAIDAFDLGDPPLLVILEKGPYTEAGSKGDPSGMPPVDKYRAEAAKAARDGTPVRAVLVMKQGPTTEAGVGVGSTLEDLKKAYPDLRVAPIPETLGKDICVGRAKSLPGIGFVFATCGKANKGEPVIRVDLWP